MFRGCWGFDLPFAVNNYAEPIYSADMVLDTSVFRTGYASRRADITSNGAVKYLVPARNAGGYALAHWNHDGKMWVSWGMRMSDASPGVKVMYLFKISLGDGTTDQKYVELRMLGDDAAAGGHFQIVDDTGVHGNAASGMTHNTWHSIWVAYDHNAGDADPPGVGNCGVEVYRDGVQILDVAFTRPAADYIHRFAFIPEAVKNENPNTQIWYDDCWCNDDAAGDITTAPSKTAYAIRLGWSASGSPTYDQWTGDPSANKWENVDDVAYAGNLDGDTTDNTEATASQKQTHEMLDCSDMNVGGGDSIYGVMAMSCMTPVAAGDDGMYSALMYADTADQTQLFVRTAGEWAWFPLIILAGDTPAGNPWSQALVNSMECGCQTEAGISTTYKCTAVYAYVAADTTGAGPSAPVLARSHGYIC